MRFLYPTSQCTSDIDNSVAKQSDTGKAVVYWCTRHLAGKCFCILFLWIPWIRMPALSDELYFDRRLPVTHLPKVFCSAFIILFGCLVACGIRESSVGVLQFDMGNIWQVDTGKSVVLEHFYETVWGRHCICKFKVLIENLSILLLNRGSRNKFQGGGVQAWRPENSLNNGFFSPQLILQLSEGVQWFYYRENFTFPRIQRGPTFFLGGPTFF